MSGGVIFDNIFFMLSRVRLYKSLYNIKIARLTRFRKSSQNYRDKNDFDKSKSRRKFSFAVFPKQSALVEPAERTLYNPSFGYYYKSMQFASFDDFNVSAD